MDGLDMKNCIDYFILLGNPRLKQKILVKSL